MGNVHSYNHNTCTFIAIVQLEFTMYNQPIEIVLFESYCHNHTFVLLESICCASRIILL